MSGERFKAGYVPSGFVEGEAQIQGERPVTEATLAHFRNFSEKERKPIRDLAANVMAAILLGEQIDEFKESDFYETATRYMEIVTEFQDRFEQGRKVTDEDLEEIEAFENAVMKCVQKEIRIRRSRIGTLTDENITAIRASAREAAEKRLSNRSPALKEAGFTRRMLAVAFKEDTAYAEDQAELDHWNQLARTRPLNREEKKKRESLVKKIFR